VTSEEIAWELSKKWELIWAYQVQTEALINHLKRIAPNLTDDQIIEFFDDVLESYQV